MYVYLIKSDVKLQSECFQGRWLSLHHQQGSIHPAFAFLTRGCHSDWVGINEENPQPQKKKKTSDISKKAGQRLGALRKIANKLDTAGRATVYKAQIRSIMEYACLSWMSASPTVLNQLDSIQQKALRIIGVDQVTACRELANH